MSTANSSKATRPRPEQPVGVPRRFGVGTMMVFTTMYAALFYLLSLCQVSLPASAVIALYFTMVAAGQAVLFGGTRPREASILAGVLAAPLLTLGYSIWSSLLWQNFESFARTMAIGIGLMPLGAVIGYVVGCTAAGVFCIMKRKLARQDDQAAERELPVASLGSDKRLWEERLWDDLGPRLLRLETQARPLRATLTVCAMSFVGGVVGFVAFAGFPSLRVLATIFSGSLLVSLVIGGLGLNRWRFYFLLVAATALFMLPPAMHSGNLIVAGKSLADYSDAMFALYLMSAMMLGSAVVALAGWLAWIASPIGLSRRDHLLKWFNLAGMLALAVLSLVSWRSIDRTLRSPQQRALARMLELEGYLEYMGGSRFTYRTPTGIHAGQPELGNAELQSLTAFPGLGSLILVNSSVDDHSTSALGAFSRLTRLSLSGSKITDDSLRHIAPLSFLQWLDLSHTSVTTRGLAELEGRLPGLQFLYLGSTDVTDAGLQHVASFGALTRLDLSDCRVTDDGLQHLANMQWLVELFLTGTEITDQGLMHLVKLPKLRRLHLSSTEITDEGLWHLAKMPKLQFVDLSRTEITDERLEHLSNLKRVDLSGTAVTPPAVARFMDSHPDCAVMTDDH